MSKYVPRRRRKRAILLLLCSIVILSACGVRAPNAGPAVAGFLDLSTGIDFDRGEVVRLDGEWEFIPRSLSDPSDFSSADPASRAQRIETRRVPGLWTAVNGFGGADPTGVGTLRLVVALPQGERTWGLRIPNANSALRVLIDGGNWPGSAPFRIGTTRRTYRRTDSRSRNSGLRAGGPKSSCRSPIFLRPISGPGTAGARKRGVDRLQAYRGPRIHALVSGPSSSWASITWACTSKGKRTGRPSSSASSAYS
jgi:hypothetical protein